MREQTALTDSDLVRKAQQGELPAFEALVHRYDKNIFMMAARYVEHSDDAKDIYQEVFIRVFRALPKFQFRSEFTTWLYRITTNVCLTHQTRRKRYTRIDRRHDENDGNDDHRSDEPASTEDAPDTKAIGAEISERIAEALAVLSPQQKLVFTLKHYEGLKLHEIAAMLKCTDGTVKKHLFIATQRLREELKEYYEDGE